MLGVVFFFKQILIFLPAIFLRIFLNIIEKGFVVNFLKSYGGLKGAILANLEQLTHDIFHAINELIMIFFTISHSKLFRRIF